MLGSRAMGHLSLKILEQETKAKANNARVSMAFMGRRKQGRKEGREEWRGGRKKRGG